MAIETLPSMMPATKSEKFKNSSSWREVMGKKTAIEVQKQDPNEKWKVFILNTSYRQYINVFHITLRHYY